MIFLTKVSITVNHVFLSGLCCAWGFEVKFCLLAGWRPTWTRSTLTRQGHSRWFFHGAGLCFYHRRPCWTLPIGSTSLRQQMERHRLRFFRQLLLSAAVSTWDVVFSSPRKIYSTEMVGPGFIRPWQCSWRADFGVSSMVDPEQAEALMELYLQEGSLGKRHVCSSKSMHREFSPMFCLDLLLNRKSYRFLTDPNSVGVDKVAATRISDAFLEGPYTECKSLPGKSGWVDNQIQNALHDFLLVSWFLNGGFLARFGRCSAQVICWDRSQLVTSRGTRDARFSSSRCKACESWGLQIQWSTTFACLGTCKLLFSKNEIISLS